VRTHDTPSPLRLDRVEAAIEQVSPRLPTGGLRPDETLSSPPASVRQVPSWPRPGARTLCVSPRPRALFGSQPFARPRCRRVRHLCSWRSSLVLESRSKTKAPAKASSSPPAATAKHPSISPTANQSNYSAAATSSYLLSEHTGIEAKIEPPDDWIDPQPDSPIETSIGTPQIASIAAKVADGAADAASPVAGLERRLLGRCHLDSRDDDLDRRLDSRDDDLDLESTKDQSFALDRHRLDVTDCSCEPSWLMARADSDSSDPGLSEAPDRRSAAVRLHPELLRVRSDGDR
jgi:hypothetical protein